MTRPSALHVQVRTAVPADRPAVASLVVARGLPNDGLEGVWRTWVATSADKIVGTASLERHGDTLLLRSVAVASDFAGAGVGARVVGAALHAADAIGPVALLTETAADWFPRFGFVVTSRSQIPAVLAASPELQHACPASAIAMLRQPPARPRSLHESPADGRGSGV